MYNRKIIYFLPLLVMFYLLSCKGSGQQQPMTADQHTAKDKMDSLHQIAQQTARTYHEMDNPALLKKLLEQGKSKKEPFNSPAYRELITRKDVDPSSLTAQIHDNPNADGLLALLLLRKINTPVYLKTPMGERVSILTAALSESKYFNSWGIPPFYLQDASRAMLECDSTVNPPLRKMLADKRPAPVFGSQEYMLYLRYKYRVCDYALYFLRRTGGDEKFVMPESAEGRDSLIRVMVR